MGKITVFYIGDAMTGTKCTSETFSIPEDGLKLSSLAKFIASRHPGIARVVEQGRWCVDGEFEPRDTFILKGGEEVDLFPRMVG